LGASMIWTGGHLIAFFIFDKISCLNMKQTLLLLFAIAIIAGCKKSAVTKSTNVTGLSGTYFSFKNIDTVYRDDKVSHGIREINVETTTGDTTYENPGTANYKILPNIIQNYNPSWVTSDTLTFTSNTAGIVREPSNSYPFTYSLKTGNFNSGEPADVHNKLVQLNATTIEWITYEGDDEDRTDVSATYFRKK
jgi:hypothetical protein